MSSALLSTLKQAGLVCLFLCLPLAGLRAEDTNATAAAPVVIQENAGPDAATRAALQLQEQVHAARLEIERTRQEAEVAAAENAETLSNRLAAIEESLTAQRMKELADLQRTNHLLLAFVVVFAVAGFAAVLLTSYFQWRAVNRMVDVTTTLAANREMTMPSLPALAMNERQLLSSGAAEQSNARLLGFIETLEKRIAELEHTAGPALNEPTVTATANGNSNGNSHPTPPPTVTATTAEPKPDHSKQISILMERGQSLLNSDKAQDSIACFDELLVLDANHAEALVKKGAALEKLDKLQDAIECYDRAIAADSSLTIAYLHKGGVCNRLERFAEAMQCYEQALHAQEKQRVA